MQVVNELSEASLIFINSMDSSHTWQSYEFCVQKFLIHYKTDLESLLKLPPHDISNLWIRCLVGKKISKSFKNQILSALKHACEMNDVVFNWKKLKKFIKYGSILAVLPCNLNRWASCNYRLTCTLQFFFHEYN